MDLFSYVLKYDSGFAPNPFGGFCTLACCKPVVRRNANLKDWVMGTTPEPDPERLTYIMKVTRSLTFDLYFDDPLYENKKVSEENPRGDNIYVPIGPQQYRQISNPHHETKHMNKDLSTNRVLISDHFYYFGKEAPRLPEEFESLIHTGRAHSRIKGDNDERHPAFLSMLEWLDASYEPGIHGEPTLDEIMCLPLEDEDIEEN